MTKRECEVKILDLMDEIRKTLQAYNPKLTRCSMNMGDAPDYDSVFLFSKDAEKKFVGKKGYIPEDEDYILRLSRWMLKMPEGGAT